MSVIGHPFKMFYAGLKELKAAYPDGKQLGRAYDIAKRLVKAFNLPTFSTQDGKRIRYYQVIGETLMQELGLRRVFLDRASLKGKPEDILDTVTAVLPLEMTRRISKENLWSILLNSRIAAPTARESLGTRIKRRYYDDLTPVKTYRALNVLMQRAEAENQNPIVLNNKLRDLQAQRDALIRDTHRELSQLQLGHEAYLEIMNAVYSSDPAKSLNENIQIMLDVITKWAYKVIGRSEHSEAAGWLALNSDGSVGIKYKYLIAEKAFSLGNAKVHTLRKAGTAARLSLSEKETTQQVSDQRGNFIASEEWEDFNVREDLAAVQKNDGSRLLYRRIYKPGSELVKAVATEKAGRIAGAFAGALTAVIGKIKNFDNAFVELEEVTPEQAGLIPGEIIPYIVEGSVIKLVSAGSNNPHLREEKLAKGAKAQEALGIGIVEQRLEKAVGNVQMSAKKPMAAMIPDVDKFHVRPQNRFLISIVGVMSYFLRSLIEFDNEGDAVCLGCLEVTNPEVISEKLSAAEHKALLAQFEMGKIFAGLASTGIMIKTLREEIDRLTLQYLGPQIFKIIKSRDYQTLQGKNADGATVMFADISGFTALSDRLQSMPEKVVALLSRVFSDLTPIVIQNGGMIDKYIGDAIMADWGVTEINDKDVENALRTAIGFQTRLQALNLQPEMQRFYEAYGIPPLGMSIGLNTGKLIAGNIGYKGSKIEFSVIGDAVNVASRIQHATERGQIAIGARTFELLSEEFKAELVSNFNLYNRDIESLKAYIVDQYQKRGKPIDQALLDIKLQEYLSIYKDAREEDLFVPAVTWAKNKGPVVYYQVKWDRNSWRNKFLREIGRELRMEPSIVAPAILSEEQKEAAMQKALAEHLAKMKARKTSAPSS